MAKNPKPFRRQEKRWLNLFKKTSKYRDVRLHIKLKDSGGRSNRITHGCVFP